MKKIYIFLCVCVYSTEKELAHAQAGVSRHVCVWWEVVSFRDGATGGQNHRQTGQEQAILLHHNSQDFKFWVFDMSLLPQRDQKERSQSEKLLLLKDMEGRKYQKTLNPAAPYGLKCYAHFPWQEDEDYINRVKNHWPSIICMVCQVKYFICKETNQPITWQQVI